MTTDIETVEEIKAEVLPVVARAEGIVIASSGDYEMAADFLKAVKGASKRVTDHFGPMKKAAHDAWKTITAKEAETLKPLQDAEARVKSTMLTYATEVERRRQEEQRRLQAEADARAEAERKKLEKEAAKLKTPELREARLEQAAAVVAPVVTVETQAPKVAGQSIRTTWKAVVIDIAVLPREWMTPNQQALDAFAKSTKGAVAVSGVKFVEVTSLASASR
jgi:hypothetical protein